MCTNTMKSRSAMFSLKHVCDSEIHGGRGHELLKVRERNLQMRDAAARKSSPGSCLASTYPVCILLVFSTVNVHESKRKHNDKEEGRSAGKEEAKGEKEMLEGGERPIISIQMMWGADRDEGSPATTEGGERRDSEEMARESDSWEAATRLIYSSQKKKTRRKVDPCVRSVIVLQLRTHRTHQTTAFTFKTSSRCYFLQLTGVKLSCSLQSKDRITSRWCNLFLGETLVFEDV